jgi:hypothetical protein
LAADTLREAAFVAEPPNPNAFPLTVITRLTINMKTLWITYAWTDNEEGDFDYLVQELNSHNLNCSYDRVALIPGKRLWEQIAEKILNSKTDAWAYLITKNSLDSEPCKEELAYALDRALSSKETGFPIIGLVHNVPFNQIPVALKARLCVSLKDPNWRQQVIAGVNSRAPEIEPETQEKFKINIHSFPNGDTAIELKTRFEELRNWRMAVPSSVIIKEGGTGISGSYNINSVANSYVEGTVDIGTEKCKYIGTGDPINSSTSAYLLVEGPLPHFFAYGFAKEPFGHPDCWYPMHKR